MNAQLQSQLDKILALADSIHDGEAVVAVRMARQVLSKNGLCFGDLAKAATTKQRTINLPFFSTSEIEFEMEINNLRQELRALENERRMQEADSNLWRQRSAELEQKLIASQAETRRWRQLAKDTVEKLWDLGQAVREEDFVISELAPAKTAKIA